MHGSHRHVNPNQPHAAKIVRQRGDVKSINLNPLAHRACFLRPWAREYDVRVGGKGKMNYGTVEFDNMGQNKRPRARCVCRS